MDLKETEILGSDIESHWYYRAKARAMTRFLGGNGVSTILDVGAGSGFFSHHLLRTTSAADAWCVDTSYKTDSDTCVAGKDVHYRCSVETVDANLVLLMDVLEHVEDDVGLLKEYVDKVPSGSFFLISVPAFQFLWSQHDEFLEHKRRYTLSHLKSVVRNAGLDLKKGAYYFGAVLPLAASLRLLQNMFSKEDTAQSQLTKHHPIVNTLLYSLCYVELSLMNFNSLGGLTVFCLARKE